MQTYEIGYSKITGEYFVVGHADMVHYGDFETKAEAEKRAKELEAQA